MDLQTLRDFDFLKQIVEALIFASDIPLSENRIKSYVEDVDGKTLKKIIDELNHEYKASKRAFRVTKVSGGYQMVTLPEFARWIKRLFKGRAKARLSQAALETLSIIAFKQPISRPEIDAIRGVNSDGVIKNLLERNLITISGRSETVGRALLYSTTPEFLRYFGINKITDLPKPRELEALFETGQVELDLIVHESATEESELKGPQQVSRSPIFDDATE